MSAPDQAAVNQLFLDFSAQKQWEQAGALLQPGSKVKPEQQAIKAAFAAAGGPGNWDSIIQLYLLCSPQYADEDSIKSALRRLAPHGELSHLKTLCEHDTKPVTQAQVSAMLITIATTAKEFKNWDKVNYLCSLQGANKPNQHAINRTLFFAAEQANWDLVVNLCEMQADNKPNINAIAAALDKAAKSGRPNVADKYFKEDEAEEALNNPPPKPVDQVVLPSVTPVKKKPESSEAERQEQARQETRRKEWEQVRQKQIALEQERQQLVKRVDARCTTLLDTLKPKIEHKGEAADQILDALNNAKRSYLRELAKTNVSILESNKLFQRVCKNIFTDAKKVFADDLSLGEYLGNLCKALGNALFWVLSAGHSNNFFSLTRAPSLVALETAEQDLQSESLSI